MNSSDSFNTRRLPALKSPAKLAPQGNRSDLNITQDMSAFGQTGIDQAESRADQANTRTEQAEARTDQANTRWFNLHLETGALAAKPPVYKQRRIFWRRLNQVELI